jgi:hypothetical protein
MDKFRFRRLEQYRVGGSGDEMELRIPLPKTPDGKVNHRCPATGCRPAVFQLGDAPEERPHADAARLRRLPGAGETICPYCGHLAADQDFIDPADVEAIKKQIAWAAKRDVVDFMKNTAKDFNRNMPRGGFISMRMDVKEHVGPQPAAWREDLLRDLTCDQCARRYGVYAVALFCPDCGAPNLGTHFRREVDLVRKQTELAEQMRAEANRELAYRLLGNAHEDVLTAFETYLKTVYRWLGSRVRVLPDEAKGDTRRNRFQNIGRARKAFVDVGFDPFDGLGDDDLRVLRLNIEKRHIVGHNLGIADESYAELAQAELPGETVGLLGDEILRFASLCGRVILQLDGKLLDHMARQTQAACPDADEAITDSK